MTPADPLREKLKALVEEWRRPTSSSPESYARYLTGAVFADQLVAILDETEPKPLKLGHEFERAPGKCHKVVGIKVCGQPREAH